MITQDIIQIMETERKRETNRRDGANAEYREKVLDFYRDNQIEYVTKYVKLSDQKRMDALQLSFTNITKKIINGINLTYINNPSRVVRPEITDDDAREKVNQSYRKVSIDKDMTMIQLDRYSSLVDEIGVKVEWNGERDKLKYRELIDEVHFALDMYCDETIATWFPVCSQGSDAEKTETMYEYWDMEHRYIVNSDGQISDDQEAYGFIDNDNNYGLIPVVRIVKDGYYAKGLINANEVINGALTQLNELIKLKSFGVPYVTGVSKATDNIKFNYDNVIMLGDPNGKAGMLENKAQLSDIVSAIKFEIETIAENYGVAFNWGIQGNVSGFSLMVQNIELYDQLKIDNNIKKDWEREIFRVENAVLITDAKSEGYGEEIFIDFAEYELPVDQGAADTHEKHLLVTDQTTPQLLLIKKNPDLSEDDADKIVAKAREEKKLNTVATTPVEPEKPVNPLIGKILDARV